MNKLFTLFLIVLFTGFVFAQANRKSEIKKINTYCKTIDIFVKRYKNPQLIFADTSQDDNPKWQKFASEKELEKFRETTETYTIAYNWTRNNKIIQSNFTLFSESGDWAKYVFYYFRAEDGTLTKIESQLNTFYGDFSLVQDIYFDRNGKILKKTVKYLDLKTQKPIKPNKENISANENNIKAIYYQKTGKLPFAYLLRKK